MVRTRYEYDAHSTYVRTSEELHEASDDDEYESRQLGVREDVLHARRPLDVIGVDRSQQRCKQQ